MLNPKGERPVRKEQPYDKYSFERLAQRGGVASKIEEVGDKFYYFSEGKRISGQVHRPQTEIKGVVIMARGYVEKEVYKTGTGTKNAAAYYAKQGYKTYAPDFSGYGESDPPVGEAGPEDENALGARLVKPVEILDLIASLPQDMPIYLWGHSNGGQIMLSVAEILGKREPSLQGDSSQVRGVTLWAPVSKPFPYNILYYTDEAEDRGKWLRSEIAKFEKDYDVFDYSIDLYMEWINIPIQIHQGTVDDSVPKKWSDELVTNLEKKEKGVIYYIYPGSDHNLRPGWDAVVERDVTFFTSLH